MCVKKTSKRCKLFLLLLFLYLMVPVFCPAYNSLFAEKPGTVSQQPAVNGLPRFELMIRSMEVLSGNEPKKALKVGLDALDLLRKGAVDKPLDRRNELKLYLLLSNVYLKLGESRKVKEFSELSMILARELKDDRSQSEACYYLGEANRFLSCFCKAMDAYSHSLQLYQKVNDQPGIAKTFKSMGHIYYELGDNTTSLEYFLRALKISEDMHDNQNVANMYINLGRAYWRMKEYQKGLEYYFKAKDFFENDAVGKKDSEGLGMVFNNIAVVYIDQKKFDDALRYLKESLALKQQSGNKYLVGSTLINIGHLFEGKKSYLRARNYYEQALELYEKAGNNAGVARALVNLASTSHGMKRYDEAFNYLKRAVSIAESINARETLKYIYEEYSSLYADVGKYKEALDFYKKYSNLSGSFFNEESRKKIDSLHENYEIKKKEKEIALLKKDKELQSLELQRQKSVKQSFVILAIAILVVSVLILTLFLVLHARYVMKVRITNDMKKEIQVRKEVEYKLRESEGKFKTLAEKSTVGICIIRDKVIKYVNPSYAAIFNYARDMMPGMNPLELIFEPDRNIYSRDFDPENVGSNDNIAFELRGITSDKQIVHLEGHRTVTYYEDIPAIMETIIDVSDRKKAVEELLVIKNVETVGIISAGVAQEFNNLLTTIVGNLSLAQMGFGSQNDKVKRYLENAENATHQAVELVKDFFTSHDWGWDVQKKISPEDIIRNLSDFIPKEKKINYVFSLPSDLKSIIGEERHLRQVMAHLLVNAFDATEVVLNGNHSNGGNGDLSYMNNINKINHINNRDKKIIISVENMELEPKNSYGLHAGEYVKISVIDKGKGIPSELLDKIFEPNFAAKDKKHQKAARMNLSVCHCIIKQHGGTMTVSSELGKGTTFDLFLPVFNDNQWKRTINGYVEENGYEAGSGRVY